MRHILVIGAGRSSSSLIKYLLDKSNSENLFITVADISEENAKERIGDHSNAEALKFDVFNEEQRQQEIRKADHEVLPKPREVPQPLHQEGRPHAARGESD